MQVNTTSPAWTASAASTAGDPGSAVLIPYNAPSSTPSADFEQVLRSASASAAAAPGASSAASAFPTAASPTTGISGATGLVPPSLYGTATGQAAPAGTALPATGGMMSGGCCCCGQGSAAAASMTGPAVNGMSGMGGTTGMSGMGGTTGMSGMSGAATASGAVAGAMLQKPFTIQADVTQSFGPTSFAAEPAYNGYAHFHTGIDYGLPEGTPVDAAAAGWVVAAGWDSSGFGNRVIIDHGNGLQTLYGHLESIGVQQGQTVQAGQQLGLSGTTGNSTGPHLHFGVQQNGVWVDPAPLLSGGAPSSGSAGTAAPSALSGTAAVSGANGVMPPPGTTPLPGSSGMGGAASTSISGGATASGSGGATASGALASTASSPSVGSPAASSTATLPAAGGVATLSTAGSAPGASSAAAGAAITGLIQEVSMATGVPESLIGAVVQAESGGDPRAVSGAGAKGLMQLTDGTAAAYGVQNVFDPAQNLLGGASYLHSLLQRYKGDETLALAAYNAGPGAVDRYGGVPPYSETQNYVRRVLRYQQQYANPQTGP